MARWKLIFRHMLGYGLGLVVFAGTVPLILFGLSSLELPVFSATIPGTDIVRHLAAGFFLTIGVVFVIWSNVYLFLRGKGGPFDVFNLVVSPRSQHLVVTGPYKYTRNPMVFGACSSYLALALYFNSIGCLAE